jgi:hypothetical protein
VNQPRSGESWGENSCRNRQPDHGRFPPTVRSSSGPTLGRSAASHGHRPRRRALGSQVRDESRRRGVTCALLGERAGIGSSFLRAGTSRGKTARPPVRGTATTPSSSGWRRASRMERGNSGSSRARARRGARVWGMMLELSATCRRQRASPYSENSPKRIALALHARRLPRSTVRARAGILFELGNLRGYVCVSCSGRRANRRGAAP